MDLLTEEEHCEKDKPTNRIYFFRQLFSCSTLITGFFVYGLYIGSTTVIVPQIRKEANSTDVISSETVSWLSSLPGYSALPWVFILPSVAYRYGRKVPLIMLTMNTLICNIIFYLSTSIWELMISQAMTGMLVSAANTITIMIITEYTSPRYRGIFMTLKSASFYWGIWASNAIGTFCHWKNIGKVIFFLSVFNFSVFFNHESPYWLATKGRFEECSISHRWLKGNSKDSEEELEKLIVSQQEYLKINSNRLDQAKDNIIVKSYKIISSKNVYKPIFYSILTLGLYNFSGKLAYTVYALDVIKKMTQSESAAYEGMLILDAVTVLGMYLGCPLTNILKRRTHLLSLASIGVGFLYTLSTYLYLIKLDIILENKYISLFLLTGFSISISCGPMVVAACCSGELAPLKYRSTFLCIFALMSSTAMGSTLKTAPFIFQQFEAHGAFLFYAVGSTVFIILLYKYLPETKDKTIQEIERHITGEEDVAKTETVSAPLTRSLS